MIADNTQLVETLVAFGNDVVERAQRNLGATRIVKKTIKKNGKEKQVIRRKRAVATGDLKNSLTFTLRKVSDGYEVTFKARGKAAQYADVVEDGRREGLKGPKTEPILQWIRTKGIKVRDGDGKILKQTPWRQRGLAYIIARRIGENGIEPVKYFENAYKDAIEEREQDILQALKSYLDKKFEK